MTGPVAEKISAFADCKSAEQSNKQQCQEPMQVLPPAQQCIEQQRSKQLTVQKAQHCYFKQPGPPVYRVVEHSKQSGTPVPEMMQHHKHPGPPARQVLQDHKYPVLQVLQHKKQPGPPVHTVQDILKQHKAQNFRSGLPCAQVVKQQDCLIPAHEIVHSQKQQDAEAKLAVRGKERCFKIEQETLVIHEEMGTQLSLSRLAFV